MNYQLAPLCDGGLTGYLKTLRKHTDLIIKRLATFIMGKVPIRFCKVHWFSRIYQKLFKACTTTRKRNKLTEIAPVKGSLRSYHSNL